MPNCPPVAPRHAQNSSALVDSSDDDHLARRRHHPGGAQSVGGQPRPVRVVPDATSEDETPDTDTQAGAAREQPRTVVDHLEDVAVERGTFHPAHRSVLHLDGVERGQIDLEPRGRRQPGVAVTPAASDRRHVVLARPLHARDDVGLVGALSDGSGADVAVAGVRRQRGGVVAGITGRQHRAAQRAAQVGDRCGAERRRRGPRRGGCRRRRRVQGRAVAAAGRGERSGDPESGGGRRPGEEVPSIHHGCTSTFSIIPRSSCDRTWQCCTNWPVKSSKFVSMVNESSSLPLST